MSAARVLREGFLEMVVPNGVPKDKSWPGGGQTCGESIPHKGKLKVRAQKIEQLCEQMYRRRGSSGLICKPFGMQKHQVQVRRRRTWAWGGRPCAMRLICPTEEWGGSVFSFRATRDIKAF